MAQKTIALVGAFTDDAKDQINDNYDELYAADVVLVAADAALVAVDVAQAVRLDALESSQLVSVGDVNTHVCLVADSGKTHAIPLVTGDIAITLPAVAVGLEYIFVSSALTAEGDDWVITATTDFGGGLTQIDTDGSAAAVIADASSKNTCTVIAPLAGTRISMICDGTNWLINGFVCAIAPPTFTEV